MIVEIGADNQRSVVALDRSSGELLWSAGEGSAAYSTPLPIDLRGNTHLVTLNSTGLLGISLEGEVLWQQAW